MIECRICNREVAGSNLGRIYIAPRSTQLSIPPWSVNEYQPWLRRQRQIWLIPIASKTVKYLENRCYTWALLRWWFTTKRRYTKCMHLLYWLLLRLSCQPKLMHLAEARFFTKFLAGASLLMSFHLGGHCRQGYDDTHSSFLAGCTRRLPGILA